MFWYKYLVKQNDKTKKNLLSSVKYDHFKGNILVCKESYYDENKKKREFTMFKDNTELCKFIYSQEKSERCLYEILLSDVSRKPYFDVDMDIQELKNQNLSPEKFSEELIVNLLEAIKVFTSHTKKKFSFHIILENYRLQGYKESESFYKETLKFVDSKFKKEDDKFIDPNVYKTVQQFRISDCHKCGKDNFKILDERLSINFNYPARCKNEFSRKNHLLKSSLLTYVKDTIILEEFSENTKEFKKMNAGSASEGDVGKALEIFYKFYNEFDFEFQDMVSENGNLLITFRRLNPTKCKMCKRIHENENPYLLVCGENRNVLFDCRRRPQDVDREYLGYKIDNLTRDIPDNKDDIEKTSKLEDLIQYGTLVSELNTEIKNKQKKKYSERKEKIKNNKVKYNIKLNLN